MTKSHSTPPKMGNNGGTAFVRINGKRTYLGKFGSADAAQNYARCVAEWAISNTDPSQASQLIGTITVKSLAVAFLDHAKKSTPNHYYGQRTAARILLELYSDVTVDSFTPKCLTAVQHQFVQQVDINGEQRSRQYCNMLTYYIRKMFRWGVAQELVTPSTAEALKYVLPLRQGRTTAPESEPRTDVPNEIVDATLPHMLPTVAAMVQVQRWATMRPNEVCRMRVGDINMNRKDGIWLYRPPKHKGTWRGHGRIIPLGQPEQALILPYLNGKTSEQPVFCTEHGRQYTSKPYRNAVARAIRKANRSLPEDQQIPHWFPYQLRHAGVTELVAENDGDLNVARAVAGQKSISITQGYNHADLKIAIEQAKKRGNLSEDSPEPLPVK
jgi:integrase